MRLNDKIRMIDRRVIEFLDAGGSPANAVAHGLAPFPGLDPDFLEMARAARDAREDWLYRHPWVNPY